MKGINQSKQDAKMQVLKNGPYLVSGNIPLYRMVIKCDKNTLIPSEWLFTGKLKSQPSYILCRCGQTQTKPFCDGTHFTISFN